MEKPETLPPIVVHVKRGPAGSNDLWSRYLLDTEHAITLFMALRAVYESIDGTLGFRNYTCWKGLCRACEVSLNGVAVKGCLAVLKPGGEYWIEARREAVVQRDLFVPGRRIELKAESSSISPSPSPP